MIIQLLKYRFRVKQRIAEQRRVDLQKRKDLMHAVSIFDTPAAKRAKAALQELRAKDWAS